MKQEPGQYSVPIPQTVASMALPLLMGLLSLVYLQERLTLRLWRLLRGYVRAKQGTLAKISANLAYVR